MASQFETIESNNVKVLYVRAEPNANSNEYYETKQSTHVLCLKKLHVPTAYFKCYHGALGFGSEIHCWARMDRVSSDPVDLTLNYMGSGADMVVTSGKWYTATDNDKHETASWGPGLMPSNNSAHYINAFNSCVGYIDSDYVSSDDKGHTETYDVSNRYTVEGYGWPK